MGEGEVQIDSGGEAMHMKGSYNLCFLPTLGKYDLHKVALQFGPLALGWDV